ncbi:Tropomyosin-2 [Madurella mycetomatis]|uniref:Tropomyosin-2 n=1 Tax=Madurella mycetomatis TaxID=100816 RepID=A0A175WBL5_9PEZI|nr:Tropomyosin-2 [Madurella mycetomatis]
MAQDSPSNALASSAAGLIHDPSGGEESIGAEGHIIGTEGGLGDAVASFGGEARSGSDQAATSAGAAREHLEIPVLEGVGSTSVGHPRLPFGSKPSHSYDRTSFLSSTSHHRRPYQRPVRVVHDYLYNPDFPEWSDDDWSYHPWPPETDDEVAYTLDRIAEPPHEGMLERADPSLWRRHITESSSDEGHRMWENLMYFYDNAMTGKIRALNALVAAHRKIRHQDDHLKYLERNLTDFYEEIEQLRKELKGTEEEQARQQERIAVPESENTRPRSHPLSLETKHQQALTAMEDQIAFQDRIITKWESLGDATQAWSDADIDSPERERRFRAVEALLKRENADVTYARVQCDHLQEKYNELKEDLKEAIESAKRLKGENASLLNEAQNYKVMTAHWESQARSLTSQIEGKKVHACAEDQKCQHEIERLTAELAGLVLRVRGITFAQQSTESPTSKSTGSFASPTGRTLEEELEGHMSSSDSLSERHKGRASTGGSASPAGQTLAEELEGLQGSLDVFSEQHNEVMKGGSEMTSHLGLIHGLLLSLQQAFQDMNQGVHRQHSQVQAIKVIFDSGNAEDISATISSLERHDKGLSDVGVNAENVVAGALEEAIDVTSQFAANSLIMGPTEATSECAEKLRAIIVRLESATSGTAARDLIVFTEECLRWGVEKGMGSMSAAVNLSVIDEHGRKLRRLLEGHDLWAEEHGADEEILDHMWGKLDALEEYQKIQEALLNEYEVYRTEHLLIPLGAARSETLWRLTNSFLESHSQSRPSNQGQLSQKAVDILLDHIRELIADEELTRRRRQLQHSITQQDAQLAEAEMEITQFSSLIDRIHTQIEVLDRLREKQQPEPRTDTDFNENTELNLLNAKSASAARTAITKAASPACRHDEAICFCTLVRFLFPRIYHSTLQGACCTDGGLITPYTPLLTTDPITSIGTSISTSTTTLAGASCHGNHGHGLLASSDRIYTLICHVLTSLTWLVLLVLIQPYNMYTTAAFLLSLLLGLHSYLYRLARHAHRCLRDRQSVFPLPDELHPAHAARRAVAAAGLPAPSVIVGSALTLFLLFAWLSYVAVTVERRIWRGDNDWRLAYLRDLELGTASPTTVATTVASGGATAGQGVAGYPYPAWSPLRVDYRLLTEPMWASFESGVHRWFICGLGLGRVVGAGMGSLGLGALKKMGAVKGWFSGVAVLERRYDMGYTLAWAGLEVGY